MHRILLVIADNDKKVERVKRRSHLNRKEVERIMKSQASDDERLEFTDDVIENNGTIADVQKQISQLHNIYLQLSSFEH